MRAVVFDAESIGIGEAPRPELRPGDVLVKVHATALNRADLLQRQGKYPPPAGESSILGLEMAGTVEEVFEGDDHGIVPGMRVCSLLGGGGMLMEAHCGGEKVIPESFSFEQAQTVFMKFDHASLAAAFPEAWMTAYQALHWHAEIHVKRPRFALIHAGASGVGVAATQLVKQITGSQVIITAGSAEKIDFCKGVGADYGINYKEGEFQSKVLEITGGEGVDVVLDFVGATYWSQNIECLAADGRMVVLGLMGGREAGATNLGAILRKRLRIQGSTLRARPIPYKSKLAKELEEYAMPKLQSGKLRIIVDRVFPMDEVSDAHEYMKGNKNKGKIVMTVV